MPYNPLPNAEPPTPLAELLDDTVVPAPNTTDVPDNEGAPRLPRQNLFLKKPVGRAPKLGRDVEDIAAALEEKKRFIEEDKIVKAIAARADSPELFRHLKHEIARETAALEFQRNYGDKNGRDTATLSKARIDALVKIANLEGELRKFGGATIDFHSERIQKMLEFWVANLGGVLQELMAEQKLEGDLPDLLLNRFLQRMEGWEDRFNDEISRRT